MAPLGPFEPRPTLAVAVSGGADSLALCLLAHAWAVARGGQVMALVCDHGLRPASDTEARGVVTKLGSLGLGSRLLRLDVAPGPALSERARVARYAALEAACAEGGVLHLLVGHHAGDQAETVAMRLLRGSWAAGLSGMSPLTERRAVRILRPLLGVAPGRLRDTLAARGVAWLEDPTNLDPSQPRARVRALRRDRAGGGPALAAAVEAARLRGVGRAEAECARVAALAGSIRLFAEGCATTEAELPDAAGLAALLQTVAGAARPPRLAQVEAWLSQPRSATLGGVGIRPAGRLRRHGWLFAREAAAMAPPVAMAEGAYWDSRFRLHGAAVGWCGALGAQASEYRRRSELPLAVLRTLPAVRDGDVIRAVPHIGVGDRSISAVFCPPRPLGAVFFAAA